MTLVERFVEPSEIDAVLEFFRLYWGSNHILGNDREYMVWQMSPERSPVFAGAGLAAVTYWDDGRLVGLIGVQSMPFNCDGDVADSAWLCNLGAAPEYLPRGVGTKLMTAVHRLPIAGIGAAGINLAVIPMYRAMRYHCLDSLPRFIRIVDVDSAACLIGGERARDVLVHRDSAKAGGTTSVRESSSVPDDWQIFWDGYTRRGYFGTQRDAGFIVWRYLQHPRLDYRLAVARDDAGVLVGASVYRIEQVRNRSEKLLRVLEIIAASDDVWDALLAHVEEIGVAHGVAFADHYSSRPHVVALRQRGWYEEDDHRDLITPSLFQPWLQHKRRINLAVRLIGATPWKGRAWKENLHVVKSDGDQDRPS